MKEQEVKIFICDHCQRKMFGKSAMSQHEKLCNQNPNNWRACSHCLHCEEISFTYTSRVFDDEYSGEGYERTGQTFRCKLLDKLMYPFKVEKKNLVKRFPETFVNQQPMPRTCDSSEYEKFEDPFGY